MDFIYVASDVVHLTRLKDAALMAKVHHTHKFINKLYIRTQFPASTEILRIRKFGTKTTLYRSPEWVQVYEYDDSRRIVRGYINIDMQLRFVATPKKDLPRYPLRLSDGELIYTSIEDLLEFYRLVIYEATHEYQIYNTYEGPLFAYQHLERLMKNYKPMKRQEFFDRIRRTFKRRKPKKTTN